MRILAGMLLAITVAITSFITVLVALDGAGVLGPDRLATDRLAAFAVSGQAIAMIPEGGVLRHRFATLGGPRDEGVTPVAALSAVPRAGVAVPPIVRRVPAEAPLASFEVAEAEERKRSAVAVAAVPPQPQLAKRPPIDTATRSALGGPKPAAASRSAPGVSSPVRPAPALSRLGAPSPDPARVSP